MIAEHISDLKKKNVFKTEISPFSVSFKNTDPSIQKVVTKFTTLQSSDALNEIIRTKPEFLKMNIPLERGARTMVVLLYKATLAPGGISLLTSSGSSQIGDNIVNYRGIIDNDERSIASFTFSETESMGLISNDEGNFVLGKIENNPEGLFMIYNDVDLIPKNSYICGTELNSGNANPSGIPFPNSPAQRGPSPDSDLHTSSILPANSFDQGNSAPTSTKCVNWYWEVDYDVFLNKGSLLNVNNYIQGIFNQVSTLYANDGISINLKTLFVWTSVDPYTGPSTGSYLTQFGNYRTSWNGDLAHLIGFAGNGGVAYVNGLKMCSYGMGQLSSQMAYSGISSSYSSVPTYSWTVGCISHEQGHQLGSNHTHDCVWNGNNTKIDDCGGYAGYSAGTCLPQPSPVLPVGGGTIMSYCHLTSSGINFNLGFGIQPKTLILNNVNASTCLTSCSTCSVPAQPGAIVGNSLVCSNPSQTYSISPVTGATSYTWLLPTGWAGTSTSNSISVTVGTSGGTISVKANNSCGSSPERTLAVISGGIPAQPGDISGATTICPNATTNYTILQVTGATSYVWTLPSGWSGTSTSNSINIVSGTSGGTISVKAVNSCGSSVARSLNILISNTVPSAPGGISGNINICAGVAQTYTIAAVSNATSYTWNIPAGWSGSSSGTSINVTTGTTGGDISVTANNNCGSSSISSLPVVFGNVPATPSTIAVSGGSALVCTGDTRTYSVTFISDITYHWVAPTGANIVSGQGTNSIVINFGSNFSTSGTLSVKAENTCGTSGARSITLSRNNPATPGTISISGESSKVCAGEIKTFSVPQVSGMSYQWTHPTGTTISSGQGTNILTLQITTAFVSSGTLSVKAVNGCGSSSARAITLSVNLPATPGSITISGGIAKVCPGDNRTYTVPNVAGVIYNWIVPSGAAVTAGQGTNSVIVDYGIGFTNGTLSVSARNNCGTSPVRSITISPNLPLTPGSITGQANVCAGLEYTYSVSDVVSASSYEWTVPADAVIQGTQDARFISVKFGSTAGIVTVKSVNGCGKSGARTFTTYINCPSSIPEKAMVYQEPQIFPNPSEGLLNIRFHSLDETQYNIKIHDVTGQLVFNKTIKSAAGMNTIQYNLGYLSNGMYFLTLQSNKENKVLPFKMR